MTEAISPGEVQTAVYALLDNGWDIEQNWLNQKIRVRWPPSNMVVRTFTDKARFLAWARATLKQASK